MLQRLRAFPLFAALLAWTMLYAGTAFAQPASGGQNFHCENGRASGSLYESEERCPAALASNNVFSFLVCNMERLSSDLMGNMYCGVVDDLRPAVTAVIVLAVVIFGAGFTIGVIPATAREFQMFLLKVSLVFVFATEADYLIGVAYHFFVTGMRDGVAIGLSGLYEGTSLAGTATKGTEMYQQLDRFLGRTIQFATDYVGAKDSPNPCQNAIFAVMAIMALAFPPVFFISVMILFKIAFTFLRAVFSYLYALVGITFLMTLAPFFLSFALFRATRQFFDRWLGYLASFALQVVLVFTFLSFVVSIDVRHISGSLVDIIMPNTQVKETTALRKVFSYCTVCDFEVHRVNEDGSLGDAIDEEDYDGFIGDGKLVCKDPKTPISIFSAASAEGGGDGEAPDSRIKNALLKFTGAGLLSLLVLAYIIDALLRYIPFMAQSLAGGMGGTYAPQLGGGVSPRSIPTTDVPGSAITETVEKGYFAGFTSSGGTSAESAIAGFKEASQRLVFGHTSATGQHDPGLISTTVDYFSHPHRDIREAKDIL